MYLFNVMTVNYIMYLYGMSSIPILCITKTDVLTVCSYNVACRFVSYLPKVGGFLRAFRFPPPVILYRQPYNRNRVNTWC